jgi:hypothetical protein
MIGSLLTTGASGASAAAVERTIRCWSASHVVCGKVSLPSEMHARAVTAMKNRTILLTKDPSSGFWAVSKRNGYEVQSTWMMASDALARTFALNPIEVRDFLDGDAGRLLADDIGFIEGGPTNAAAIEALINARLRHLGWQRLYQQAISQIRGCRQSGHAQPV